MNSKKVVIVFEINGCDCVDYDYVRHFNSAEEADEWIKGCVNINIICRTEYEY